MGAGNAWRVRARAAATSALLVILTVLLPLAPSIAQSCQPRPPVRISSVSAGVGRLTVTVTAGSGALQRLVFAPGGNALVEIDGQTRSPPFTYQVPGGVAQKGFGVVRDGAAATPTTLSFTVTDGCGPWNTLVGGGNAAWEVPVSGQVVNAGDGQPLAGATVQVEGTSLTAATDADGRFNLNLVPKGRQSLKTNASAFLPDTRSIEVGAGAAPQVIGLHRPATASLPTQVGSNIVVAPDTTAGSGVVRSSVTFAAVTSPGTTTVQRTNLPLTGVPPSAEVVAGAFFEIHTTAGFSGPVTLELPYDPTSLNGADPSQLRLMHQENGVWVDRTTSVDTDRRVIRGQSTGFSLFAPIIDRALAIFSPTFPAHSAPGAGYKVIFIPGIVFACGFSLFGVPTLLIPGCDKFGPYGTIERGEGTFAAIRSRLKTTTPLRALSYSDSDFRYFAYAPRDPEFRGTAYRGSHTRRAIATSAADLVTQLDDWGTGGKTYDIIAHSLGGAIAAYWALTDLSPAHQNAVRSITTLDSPVNGMKNVLGDAGQLIGASQEAGRDLQADGVINAMQAGARLGRLVTFANDEDPLVDTQAALMSQTCPKLVNQTVQGCKFRLQPAKPMDKHSIIHDDPLVLDQIDRILTGLTVSGRVMD